MILRYDRIAMELPPPSDPDPAGAAAVQELMGGRFGEMSTFMNYTFQSFNFRGRQGARPFYDLVANIAAEEFGHVELVATAINTMLTGASPTSNGGARSPLATKNPLAEVKGIGNPQHFLAGGQGALPQNSQGRPWNGDYVFCSGDLVEDLTHNFFLETGARNNKLKVYEMVEHPAARALTGYLLVRGGVHQIAYARAIENLTGADLTKMFPTPRIPTEKIPECKPHIERGDHLRLYRFSPNDYEELAAVFNGTNPETGEDLVVVDEAPEGVPPRDLPPQPAVFAPDYAPEEIAEIATKLRQTAGLPKEPTGLVADLEAQTKRSSKKATSRSKARSSK
jgi:Mn-containing catalase